ncbi:MAG: PepSY domain-containing protein [Gammaproteobacteria bacterium]|jgi:hypothetical protein
MNGKKRWTLHRLHKWAGLIAGVWLAVLGISGLLLDHRHDWRWLWQSTVAADWLPEDVIVKARTGVWRLYQIHPHDKNRQIVGGPQGLWWTANDGTFWKQTRFAHSNGIPSVNTALIVERSHQLELWLATDDGIWLSKDFGQSAQAVGLTGENITSLTQGHVATILLGVRNRSRVFQFDTSDQTHRWLELANLRKDSLPHEINLSRWVHDLHFGRGFLYGPLDFWINDFTGAALLLLPLTGFLFWYLPKRWREQKPQGPAPATKKHTMRTLLRTHSSITGIVLCIPILYLAITGIFLDHGKELRQWLKSTAIPQNWQTPVYAMHTWDKEIYAIAAYPNAPQHISLGTRLGLFTTHNLGKTWHREASVNGFVWTLKRIGNTLFLGGMGAPNRLLRNGTWHIAKGSGHMPTDVTQDTNGVWHWINAKSVMRGGLNEAYVKTDISFPIGTDIPWYYVLDALHSGMLFTPHWKWVNDAFALLAVFLVISGLTRWWRTKWV